MLFRLRGQLACLPACCQQPLLSAAEQQGQGNLAAEDSSSKRHRLSERYSLVSQSRQKSASVKSQSKQNLFRVFCRQGRQCQRPYTGPERNSSRQGWLCITGAVQTVSSALWIERGQKDWPRSEASRYLLCALLWWHIIGAALALSQAASQCLQGCAPIKDCFITATFHIALTPLTFIQVYASTNDAEPQTKEISINRCSNRLRSCPQQTF